MHLLIPGPFTLHANFSEISHYPPVPSNTTSLATTFKSFQLLKNYQNILYEPQFRFPDELRSISRTDSTFSFLTSAQKRPSAISLSNCQETWKCGLNINPSSYRFFNLTSPSPPSVRTEVTKKVIFTKKLDREIEKFILHFPDPIHNLQKRRVFFQPLANTKSQYTNIELELGISRGRGIFILKLCFRSGSNSPLAWCQIEQNGAEFRSEDCAFWSISCGSQKCDHWNPIGFV